MLQKKEIRKNIIRTLKDIDAHLYRQWSDSIAELLTTLPDWKNAKTIGITISGSHEVDTEILINQAWKDHKTIVVPKCHPSNKSLEFRAITSFSQLETVYYGLKEPIESQTERIEDEEIDLLIVPGLCFTKEGYRLGHGGGYYDRYLAKFNQNTISLAFPIQIVDSLPVESFDIPVKKIITVDRVLTCYE